MQGREQGEDCEEDCRLGVTGHCLQCREQHREQRQARQDQHGAAPVAVAEHAAEQRRERQCGAGDQRREHRDARRQVQLGKGEGGHVVEEVLGDGASGEDQQAEQQGPSMIAEQLAEQVPGASLAAASGKGLGQVEADVQAYRQDQQAGREGNPPAPFLQLALVEPEGEQVAHQPGGDRRDALRHDLPAGVGAALVRRCRLEDVGGRRPGLAAPGQALQQAGQHQQQRRSRADAVVAGEHRDAAGAQRHQEQGRSIAGLRPARSA